jgi:hypothetical protein
MKPCVRAGALIALLAFVALPLIASTRVLHRWMLTGAPIPPFRKVLVANMIDNYVVRQEFEDEMKKLLAKYGVEGVQSYMVLPPMNEMMEGELKQRIKESSLDGVLVIRPKAVQKETVDFTGGGSYLPPTGYYAFWPYWNAAYGGLQPDTSYKQDDTLVRVEFNLYSTKDERLVWSGETGRVHSDDFEKSGKEYATKLVNELRKDKIIRKK